MQTKRLFLKLSGQSLQWAENYGIDQHYLRSLAQKLITLHQRWYQLWLMTGAGNIFRGSKEWQGIDPAIGHYAGMMGTMINALVLGDIIKQAGSKVIVLAAIAMPRFVETFSKRVAIRYIEQGYIVICAGGCGNPFHTTDLWSVTRALEMDCDLLIKCTRVDGVYTANPETDPQAQRIDTISMQRVIEEWLNVLDISAIALAKENNLSVHVCHIDSIDQFGQEGHVGTVVYPS